MRSPKAAPIRRPTPGHYPYPDPLEQFDVLSVFGAVHFTNLALILTLNLVLMAIFLGAFSVNGRSAYDYILRSLYQLVRSMVKENIYIRKQQYFAVLFYLFMTLLLANMIGLLPYSFTVTSSFVVTFFIALTYFMGINLIAVYSHR
jgi:F-type H+-transporting ATPase subunit a